jgi:catechol 2,3-dioxygenase-like lactoylglutathione lyase family enzyme
MTYVGMRVASCSGKAALTNVIRFLLLVSLASPLAAQTNTARPHILGIAHVALYASDLDRARAFYRGLLGFEEPFTLTRSDGSGWIDFIKINDEQYLELSPDTAGNGRDLNHFALHTDDAVGMRSFLASRGIDVLGNVHKGNIGNDFFSVRDPDGHLIEIVQYEPDSWTGQDRGAHMPSKRVSGHIMQIGLRVGAPNPTLKFYKEVLGFEELRRGDSTDGQAPSITLRVPDGRDRLELLLYRNVLAPFQQSVQERVYFERNDVQQAVAELRARSASSVHVGRILLAASQTGIASLNDPDGTLLEIAQPAVLANQPPPVPAVAPR